MAPPGASRPSRSWPSLLTALIARQDLDAGDTAWAMEQVMSGDATPAQVAAFVVALRAKGETVGEVTGLAETMLRFAAPFPSEGLQAVDVVGTGGDRANTVNISTMAAMVVAASGPTVVKHGNRAASSACGAADLLEELGVALDLAPGLVSQVARDTGITFCFAPVFHASMRHAAVPRREMGIPTVFNFLGPLTNPARPTAQAVGCADPRMAHVMAGVFADRGVTALVVRGDDGLDELTTTTTSTVWVAHDGEVTRTSVDPARVGVPAARPEDLRGADAAFNASVARDLLAGKPGPVRDTVLLNAAAALVAAGEEPPEPSRLEQQLAAQLVVAAEAVDSGAAAALLQRWVQTSQALAARR